MKPVVLFSLIVLYLAMFFICLVNLQLAQQLWIFNRISWRKEKVNINIKIFFKNVVQRFLSREQMLLQKQTLLEQSSWMILGAQLGSWLSVSGE